MITLFQWILLTLIALISLIDLKTRQIPSIFLTGILFITFSLNLSTLPFLLLTGIVAWLLYEADFYGGIADVKVMLILGATITSLNYEFLLIILTLLFGFAWKLIWFFKLKASDKDEIPFIPVFLLVYIALLVVQEVI